jgi:integrative and conjugative element protein (TIGR02256 family)
VDISEAQQQLRGMQRMSTEISSTILVSLGALEEIVSDVRSFGHDKERGGILLGKRRGPHLEVTEATRPMRWDSSTMFSFCRSANGHSEIAIKRWKQSSNIVDWIGEWHSHPENDPTPSSIDVRSWNEITEQRTAPMVFLIVGWKSCWIGLCVPHERTPITYREVERSADGIAFQVRNRAVQDSSI